ncbi:MAG: TPM domain-containing protein, partial [Tepidisphaeraceae bacterium]
MNTRRHVLIGSLTALLLVTLTSVMLADVRDNAGFFSEDAVRQANFDLREIKRQYGKDLLVETYPTVPASVQPQLDQQGADAFFQQWARQRGQAAKTDGVVVLITKDPSHLQVTPGDKTKARAFTLDDRDRMRDVLVTRFREKNYDQGLLGAVSMFRDTLKVNLGSSGAAAAAVERSGAAQRSDAPQRNPGAFEPSRTQETSRRPGGGGISFWTILIWGIIILMLVRLIRRLFRGRTQPQQGFDPRRGGVARPGYDPRVDQGRPGFGGGGFGT